MSQLLNDRLADLMVKYQGEIIQVHKKIQEERALHSNRLVNMYLEACRTEQPKPVIIAVEDALAHRTERNDAKMTFDAARWAHYEGRAVQTLGGIQQAGILQGGRKSVSKAGNRELVKALHRSNELLGTLYEQLAQDRKVHREELKEVIQKTRSRQPAPSKSLSSRRRNYEEVLNSMAEDAEMEGESKFEQDAVDWAAMDETVQADAPEVSNSILGSYQVTCDGESQVFDNQAGAEQWKLAKQYFSRSNCSELVQV